MKDRIYPTIVLLVLGLLVFILIRSFTYGILSALVISFFMLPLFRKISKKIPQRVVALLIIFLLILILFVIIYIVSSELVEQANKYLDKESVMTTFDLISEKLSFETPALATFINELLSKTREIVIALASKLISQIPTIAINVILTFFLSYYLLVNWESFSRFVKRAVPFKNKNVIKRIESSFYHIFYGLSIIAIIEFIIALVGFWIAGVPLFLFLALLVGVAAFIPFFGPIAVWLPLLIYYFISGNYYSMIVILITGLTLTIFVEEFLYHIIVGKTSKINPAFMILGVLGGVAMFGFFGFILGPLLIITFIEFYKEYLNDVEDRKQSK